MTRLLYILFILNFLIGLVLLLRCGVSRRYLNKYSRNEFLLSIICLLLGMESLEIYLLKTDFFLTRRYTYILSYGHLLLGPAMFCFFNDVGIIRMLKKKIIYITLIVYTITTYLLVHYCYLGKISPRNLYYPYNFTTLYTLGFAITCFVLFLKKSGNKKDFKVKMVFCSLLLAYCITCTFWLGHISFTILLFTILLSIIYQSIAQLISSNEKYSNNRQPQTLHNQILEKFKKLVKEDMIHLDPECKLGYVSNMIGVRSDQLSQVINTSYRKRFNDVINEYRIEYSKELMKEDMTMLDISLESGFSSKSSFYTYFKRITGISPAQYKKKCMNL